MRLLFIFFILFHGIGEAQQIVKKESVFHDAERNRDIPVALYYPASENLNDKEVIIFSHGYGQNKGDDNLYYSYLTEYLASEGYFVASIQHELPTDELLAMDGDLRITRRPNWERGAKNIEFVLNELQKIYPELDYKKLSIIGHSNGGDMSVLFAEKNPNLVNKIITLDQRRYPFPRMSKPRIYSLRSADYPADEGVLPTQGEQEQYGMTIIKLDINHSEMDDDANESQREIITGHIINFLKE